MHAVYQSVLSNPNKKRSESEYLTKTWVRASWSRILVIKSWSWNSDLIYSLVFSTHLKSISQFGSFPQVEVKTFDTTTCHLLVDFLVYWFLVGSENGNKNRMKQIWTHPTLFSTFTNLPHLTYFFLEKINISFQVHLFQKLYKQKQFPFQICWSEETENWDAKSRNKPKVACYIISLSFFSYINWYIWYIIPQLLFISTIIFLVASWNPFLSFPISKKTYQLLGCVFHFMRGDNKQLLRPR